MRFCVLFGMIALVGCGGSSDTGGLPPLHAVKGSVTRGGQAVTGGYVTFNPEGAVLDAVIGAKVKPDGTFEIITNDTKVAGGKPMPGVPEGQYRVTYLPPGTTQEEINPVELPAMRLGADTKEIRLELPALPKK